MPHLALGEAIQRRGHRVYVYVERQYASIVVAGGCIPIVSADRPSDAISRCRTTAQLIEVLEGHSRQTAVRLLGLIAEKKIGRIVTDALDLGSGLASERAGLPWATMATTPAVLHSSNRKSAQALIPTRSIRRHLGLARRTADSAEQCISPQSLLLPWTAHFDAGRPPSQALHVGPLNWDAPSRMRFTVSVPLVLVTVTSAPFDAMTATLQHYVEEAITALNGLPVLGIVTLGEGRLRIRVKPKANVRLERYLPHSELMPRASALITQGGWGTIGRALTQGVPLIAVPIALDQPLNAFLCVRNRLGFRIDAEKITALKIRQRLDQLLAKGSPERRSAERFSRTIHSLRGLELATNRVLSL